MKELVVIIGTLLLGVIIFNMMVGPEDNSFKSHAKDKMVQSTMMYQENYE